MNTDSFVAPILDQFYLAEQVDLLHLALTNLFEMVNAGEVDLILDQREKNAKQKKAFIEKIVSAVESPELKKVLEAKLEEDDLEFFRERSLVAHLEALEKAAEDIVIVKLWVAIDFKEKDYQEMVALLSQQLGQRTAIDVKVEHSQVGGAIVQYGTAIRDYTVKTRFEQIREHWKKAVVEG